MGILPCSNEAFPLQLVAKGSEPTAATEMNIPYASVDAEWSILLWNCFIGDSEYLIYINGPICNYKFTLVDTYYCGEQLFHIVMRCLSISICYYSASIVETHL